MTMGDKERTNDTFIIILKLKSNLNVEQLFIKINIHFIQIFNLINFSYKLLSRIDTISINVNRTDSRPTDRPVTWLAS